MENQWRMEVEEPLTPSFPGQRRRPDLLPRLWPMLKNPRLSLMERLLLLLGASRMRLLMLPRPTSLLLPTLMTFLLVSPEMKLSAANMELRARVSSWSRPSMMARLFSPKDWLKKKSPSLSPPSLFHLLWTSTMRLQTA